MDLEGRWKEMEWKMKEWKWNGMELDKWNGRKWINGMEGGGGGR